MVSIRVIYKKGVLQPLKPLKYREGEKLEIEVKPRKGIIEEIERLTKPTKKEIIEEAIELTESGADFE